MKSKRLYYLERIAQILFDSSEPDLKVEQIAGKLGVSRKTIYNHFDSKRSLVEEVVDFHLMRKIGELRKSISQVQSPISSLVTVGRIVRVAYNDVVFLAKQSGISLQEEILSKVYHKHLEDLVEITQFLFRKGVGMQIFESDINTLAASQIYLSSLSVVNRHSCLLKASFETTAQQNTLFYYLLKGYCTGVGLILLREMVDIKISSDSIKVSSLYAV
jgi:AcrR family transcriptional regulator